MSGSSVSGWLASLGLAHYAHVLEGSGYSSIASLERLNDNILIDLGVLDSNHRRAILNKASTSGGAASVTDDFENMLGDLDSVIKDLEMFSVVPSHIDNTSTSSPAHKQRASMILHHDPLPPAPPKPSQEQDAELDLLLSDLTSFNPSEVVAETHPPPKPPSPQPQPKPSPPMMRAGPPSSSTTSSAQSTPKHNHMGSQPTPTPPSTPGHTPIRSYTQADRAGSQSELHQRSMSESSPARSKHESSEEPTVVTVPQPDLSGATEQMNAEAVQRRLDEKAAELRNDPSLTDVEREMILKEEKMRIGIEKMKIAHKRRVAIKFFNPDRSNKTVVVEEGMTAGMVCHLLVNKNHFDESPNWVIVEQLGDVSLERELEDHECVVTVYSSWPRDHNNVFLFKQNERKYDLFEDPIKYFPDNLRSSQAATNKQSTLERTEKARKILLQEYFSSTSRVPELEGFLNLKDGYKKSWKKVYIILRASGLYYSTKGKSKTAKHLVLLCHFDEYELFHGINFKKTLKAPTDFCFALRPIPKAVVPLPKDIKVICCDDEQTALSWTAGIRLAKYGLQLRDNFHKAKMTQFKLEDLAAPEGVQPNADKRASKLIGFRLDKHLDKVREQYKQQKEEEELRRKLYNSPHLLRPDGDEREGSTDLSVGSVGTSDHTGEEPSPHGSPSMTPKVPPQVAPKPNKPTPAPKPSRETTPQTVVSSNGVVDEPIIFQQQQQGGPYNPYPAPTQPAPPPHVSPEPGHVVQPPQPAPRRTTPSQQPPASQPRSKSPATPSPDKEALFVFAWYHGAIPRDEAVRRLEGVGGYDGCYLVRDSTTVPNSYVLTMYAKGVSKNFQILPAEHPSGMVMYRIDDGPPFATIDQLLKHYKQTADRLPCRLTEFCPRPPSRMTEC